MNASGSLQPGEGGALFGSGGLEIGVAPSADLQPAANPAERFGGVRSNFGGADFALLFALTWLYPGGAMGIFKNLVGDDLLILVYWFSLHDFSGA